MVSINRWFAALLALALTAPGLMAQEEAVQDTAVQDTVPQDTVPQDTLVQDTVRQDTVPPDTVAAEAAAAVTAERPIPAGLYTFVPGESEDIGPKAREAVSHLFFAIRGIARRRLEGANEPIDRVVVEYAADTVLVSLREDEPVYRAVLDGDSLPYTREGGEVIQVAAEAEPGMLDMYFVAEDGMKEMVFRLRDDGKLAVESITYSDKLEEPFRYTWVYAPEEAEGGEAAPGKAGSGPAATGPAEPDPGLRGRPVHTYSIVARDAHTGELGVAVQSHWFSVGPLVAWAEPGVGAVATQSFVDPSYGPLGLEVMMAGKTAEQALDALVLADDHPEVRQVAMVDADGNVAVHTGEGAIQAAGHRTGPGYSVQANLMLSETVPDAMARAYESTEGDLTERLMRALEAAEAEGGDIRGKQSAAILVVSGERATNPWEGRVVELRVEDHPAPVEELRRLVTLSRAYAHMNAGDEALTEGDVERALEEYSTAREMVPDAATNGEMAFWHAVTLASLGRVEASLPLFRAAFAQDENWRTLVPRLVEAGQFPDDEALVRRVTGLEVER